MVGNSREDLATAPAPAHSQEPAPLPVSYAPAADEAVQVQSVSVPATSDRSSPHPSQKLEQAEAPRTPVHDHDRKQQRSTTTTMISPGSRREHAMDPGQRPPAAYNHLTPSKPRHLPADAHQHAPTLAPQPQPASLLATDARAHSTADDVDELAEEEEEEEEEEEVPETSMTTSSEDARYIEMLKLHDEIEELESAIDGLSDYYKIVDRLGEGTFSSVYKAIDVQHFSFDNDEWVTRGPLDPFRKGVCHVALKKIYVTSSPQRIFNELSIMEDLRPAEYVSYLITAFRSEDQIVAVMPYSRHRDFRDYYKEMPLGDFKYYFRCLFSALHSVHDAGIMHRDIKPANFLYDPSTGHGTLCDFGLAERFEPTEWRGKCHHTCPTPRHPHGTKEINRAVDSIYFEPGKPLAGRVPTTEGLISGSHHSGPAASTSADSVGGPSRSGISAMDPPPERVGYLLNDARQPVRANRAGTRGFRAPEVLFKCQDQTVAIDIWSAGVILLTLLIRRFPVFNSNDDVEALLEIAAIFGKARMETCAMLHNRTFVSNVPTIQHTRTLTDFIFGLNPQLAHADSHPNPEQYRQDLLDALDLVKSCLHLNCTSRKTAGELLEHPFLRIDPMEEEVMQQEQDFADYYQGGDEVVGAGQDMAEENELGETEDDEYASREQVVQLQSRRGNSAEPTDAPNTPQQQQQQHDATATISPAPQPL